MQSSLPHPDSAGPGLPRPNPLVIVIVASLWVAFACGLPLHQVREARRQAREDLQALLAADQPDRVRVVATFERANQNLDAAASGPCILLAVTGIFLVRQLLKLKRRYNELEHDLRLCEGRAAPLTDHPLD